MPPSNPHKSIFRTLFDLDPITDDINRIMVEALPCQTDPLDNPEWKRWSR